MYMTVYCKYLSNEYLAVLKIPFSLPTLMVSKKCLMLSTFQFQVAQEIHLNNQRNDAYGHFSNVFHRTAWCIDPHGDYDNEETIEKYMLPIYCMLKVPHT